MTGSSCTVFDKVPPNTEKTIASLFVPKIGSYIIYVTSQIDSCMGGNKPGLTHLDVDLFWKPLKAGAACGQNSPIFLKKTSHYIAAGSTSTRGTGVVTFNHASDFQKGDEIYLTCKHDIQKEIKTHTSLSIVLVNADPVSEADSMQQADGEQADKCSCDSNTLFSKGCQCGGV